MGKVTFWGYPNRVDYKYSVAHKYKYVRHLLGPEKREVYVKIPNIDGMKKIIEARKLMHMNYVFGGSYSAPATKNWTEWRDAVLRIKNGGMKKKYITKRKKRSLLEKLDDIKAYTSQTAHLEIKNQGGVAASVSPGSLESKSVGRDFGSSGISSGNQEEVSMNVEIASDCDAYDGALRIPVTSETTSTLDLHSYSSRDSNLTLTRSDRKRHPRPTCNPHDYLFQRKQSELALKMRKFRQSNEASEVILSNRLGALDSADAGTFHTTCSILLESMQAGIHSHDWSLVLKCAEGLAREMSKTPAKHWILWNGGVLALMNVYKNDISKILDFASRMRDIMVPYPPRLNIEVATWLTQKGYFTNAAFLMGEENDQYQWRQRCFRNSKRDGMDFIVAVFQAVNEYSLYKRDMTRLLLQRQQNNTVLDEEHDALRQSGEYVLSLFENLVEMGNLIDNDSTIFIERLIELLLEFRSKDKARTMLQKLCRKNWANGVLVELYMHFLEVHFPDLEEEINYQKRALGKFDFTIPLKQRKRYSQKCTQFIKKGTKKAGPQFKQLPKPAFGW